MRIHALKLYKVTAFSRVAGVSFNQLDAGLVAITGPTGAGKTTILESMGPIPLFLEMPTRGHKGLANWFEPGGYVELTFSLGDHRYESRVERTSGKSGRIVATLLEDGRPIVSGLSKDYRAKTQDLFGDKRAFYASVFGPQGGGGGLLDLPVAERKRLFDYYLDLDRIADLHTRVSTHVSAIPTGEAIQAARAALLDAEGAHRDARQALAEAQGAADASQEALQGAQAAEEAARLSRVGEAYSRALAAIVDVEEAISAAAATLDALPVPDEAEIARLDAVVSEGQVAKGAVYAERARVDALQGEMAAVEGKVRSLDALPCNAAPRFRSCPFLTGLVADYTRLAGLEVELAAARERLDALDETIASGEAALPALQALRLQAKAREDRGKILHSLRLQLDIEARRASDLRRSLPPQAIADAVDYDMAASVLREARARAEADRQRVAEAARRAGQADERLERASATTFALEARANEARPAILLARALGPSGVRAYELDMAFPEISSIANALLGEAYEGRFAVDLVTQRDLKSGGVGETFDIEVVDTAMGRAGQVADLSGGEKAVIGEALRTSLALFARRKVKVPFLTLYRDEPMSALDEESARRFILLLQAARRLGGFEHIFVITHSPFIARGADAELSVSGDGRRQINLTTLRAAPKVRLVEQEESVAR